MNPTQCRMGRAAVSWSVDQLGEAAGVSRRTVLRFEAGETVQADTIDALWRALEKAGVQFIMSGNYKGAVIPPRPKPIEDRSSGNPLLPKSGR